jgi:hypothetical protein
MNFLVFALAFLKPSFKKGVQWFTNLGEVEEHKCDTYYQPIVAFLCSVDGFESITCKLAYFIHISSPLNQQSIFQENKCATLFSPFLKYFAIEGITLSISAKVLTTFFFTNPYSYVFMTTSTS